MGNSVEVLRIGNCVLYGRKDVLYNGESIARISWRRGEFVLKTVDRRSYLPEEGSAYLLGGVSFATAEEAFRTLAVKLSSKNENVDLQVVPYPRRREARRFHRFRWDDSSAYERSLR